MQEGRRVCGGGEEGGGGRGMWTHDPPSDLVTALPRPRGPAPWATWRSLLASQVRLTCQPSHTPSPLLPCLRHPSLPPSLVPFAGPPYRHKMARARGFVLSALLVAGVLAAVAAAAAAYTLTSSDVSSMQASVQSAFRHKSNSRTSVRTLCVFCSCARSVHRTVTALCTLVLVVCAFCAQARSPDLDVHRLCTKEKPLR